MHNQDLVCARTSCQLPLDRGYYKIYNQPESEKPNVYCPRCGRKIVELNPGIRREISLHIKKLVYNF